MNCGNNTRSKHQCADTLRWKGYIRHINTRNNTTVIPRDHTYCSKSCYHEHRKSQPIPQYVNGLLTRE